MEKAILKTLIYSNIFNCPLKAYEIHRWLIGREMSLHQVEQNLTKLIRLRKVKNDKGYYFLPGEENKILKRKERQKQSLIYIRKVKLISKVLKIIPWIKLIGISGGLAMENAGKKDDIDLFIIVSKKRIWISRLLILGILEMVGQRRRVGDNQNKAVGKICPNILVEEDNLEQRRKDIYTAHEVLQMKVLWQRDNIYSKYLSDNEWVFKFLPNWIASARGPASSVSRRTSSIAVAPAVMRREPSSESPLAFIESLAKNLQLWIMKKPKGMERIEEGGLYFHPNDLREKILREYEKKTRRISNT